MRTDILTVTLTPDAHLAENLTENKFINRHPVSVEHIQKDLNENKFIFLNKSSLPDFVCRICFANSVKYCAFNHFAFAYKKLHLEVIPVHSFFIN